MNNFAVRVAPAPTAPWHSPVLTARLAWAAAAVAIAATITAVEPPVALRLSVFVVAMLVSVERVDFGLGFLIASIPIQDGWPVMIAGHSVTWTRIVYLAVTIAWLGRLFAGRARFVPSATVWWFCAYCGALILSVVSAHNLTAWSAETYRWSAAFVVLLITIDAARQRGVVRAVMLGIGFGVLFSTVVAIDQLLTSAGPASFKVRGLLRAYGLFGEPNPFAAYLELSVLPLLALALSMMRDRASTRWNVIATVMLLVAGCGVVSLGLTQSRGGGMGFLAGLAVIGWFEWRGLGRTLLVAGALLMAIALLTPPAAPVRALFGVNALLHSGPEQVTPANFATQERLAHWGAAVRMWLDEPLLGIGAGNFSERYREYTPNWRFRISRGHAHSAYLQAAAQAGSLGLVCFVALIGASWRRCWRAIGLARDENARGVAVGALAVTTAIAVHGVFDYVHVLSLSLMLSVIWGIVNDERVCFEGRPLNHDSN